MAWISLDFLVPRLRSGRTMYDMSYNGGVGLEAGKQARVLVRTFVMGSGRKAALKEWFLKAYYARYLHSQSWCVTVCVLPHLAGETILQHWSASWVT